MKKIFLLILFVFLSACSPGSEVKEEAKNEISKPLSEEDIVYEALNGKNLKDDFESSDSYSSLNFYSGGEFDGDFLSNSDIDDKDYGLREESDRTYKRSEIHKSVFSGKFKLKEKIGKGIYRLDLVDFTINNEVGPDEKIKYQSWVDFAEGLNKGDEYILYLKGAVLDEYLLENNQYNEQEIQIQDHEEEENHEYEDDDHDHKEEYRAYSIIIYNKSQKLIFTAHDKWAQTYHKH